MPDIPEHKSFLNDDIYHSFLSLHEAPFCPIIIIYSILSWHPSSSVNLACNFSQK